MQNSSAAEKPKRFPLTERLKPFRYRNLATHQADAIPEGFTPRGGCKLPHNASLYDDPAFGKAQVDSFAYVGTHKNPILVERQEGLFPRAQTPSHRTLSSFRQDALGHNRALGGHITGRHNRGYQSSTTSLNIALDFSVCRGPRIVPSGWVYGAFVSGVDVRRGRIMDLRDKRSRATSNFKQMTLGVRETLSARVTHLARHEREIAVPDGILADEIVAARKTSSGAGGWHNQFTSNVWVDPSLPDEWYNKIGVSMLTPQERLRLRR